MLTGVPGPSPDDTRWWAAQNDTSDRDEPTSDAVFDRESEEADAQARYENGSLATTERWTAIVTVVIDTPHDAERLRKNPLGVFIHAINWSKELG